MNDITVLDDALRQHRGAVYGYLRARVSNAADAEYLTREVFLRFHADRKRLTDDDLRPWLIGTARELLREHVGSGRRKASGWAELCLDLDDAEPLDDATLARFPTCLDGLGPSAREALGLKYGADWSPSKIGERLRRSENAVKELLFRARQTLRRCLVHGYVPDPLA